MLQFRDIRLQLSEALQTKLRSNRARIRVVVKVGNDSRSSSAFMGDVPGQVEVEDTVLWLPADLQGRPFSIHLYAKPIAEMARTSSSSKMDQLVNKANTVAIPEALVGACAEQAIGSIKNGAFVQSISACRLQNGVLSPLSKDQIAVMTCTCTSVAREPLSVTTKALIAPRKVRGEMDEIKTVESCRLLQGKITAIKQLLSADAKAPSRYKQPEKRLENEVHNLMEMWPPRVDQVGRLLASGDYESNEEVWKNWNGQTVYHYAVLSESLRALHFVQRIGLSSGNVELDADGIPIVKKKLRPLYKASDKDDNGVSAFILAVILGNADVINAIAEFDPDAVNQTLYSLTPLHIACGAGDLATVRLFMEQYRLSQDIRDQNSATPLFYACYVGKLDVVEYLCEHAAFVDMEDCQSQSPILMALEASHEEVARYLLANKADVNAFNLRGENAIWLSGVRQMPALLADFVLSGVCDLNSGLERHRNTLLHKIILFVEDEQKASMVCASLLAHGAKVDSLNAEKKTPLFLAAALSRPKLVTLLLNSGASAKATDSYDNTPLHFAFLPQIVASLGDKGARLNAANMDGLTPMHVMSAFGLVETMSCLRALGGKDSVKNAKGNTPGDIFNLIAPKDWYVCMPFFAEDTAAATTGGIVINDKPRSENAASLSATKTKMRNSFRAISSKVRHASGKASEKLAEL